MMTRVLTILSLITGLASVVALIWGGAKLIATKEDVLESYLDLSSDVQGAKSDHAAELANLYRRKEAEGTITPAEKVFLDYWEEQAIRIRAKETELSEKRRGL